MNIIPYCIKFAIICNNIFEVIFLGENLNDIMKMEIAEELGLLEKVNSGGWKSLTAKESGRIGGILARRKKKESENV
jgi:hypothetical protein